MTIKKTILIMLLLIPFIVLAKDTCNQDDIKIEKIELEEKKGNAEELSLPNNENNTINLNTRMNVIGDSITYKVIINNTSTSDYSFDNNQITTEYVDYIISYEDNSSTIKANSSKIIYLKVDYKDIPKENNLSEDVLQTNKNIVFNLTNNVKNTNEKTDEFQHFISNPETKDIVIICFIALLISSTIIIAIKKKKGIKYIVFIIAFLAIVPNLTKAICSCSLKINLILEIDTKEAMFLPGEELNVKIKKLAGDESNDFHSPNSNIYSIRKSEQKPLESNKEEKNIVSTSESSYPIYMWFDEGTIYWWSEDKTPSLNKDAKNSFTHLNELKDITGIKHFDTSVTENMADLLSFAYSLVSVDELTNWNTSNVTSLRRLFIHNHDLASVEGVKNWDVRKVVDMGQVFNSCYSLEEVDLSNWETNSVENMQTTFGMWELNGNPYYNSKLKRIIISNKFNTSKVIQMYGLFANNLNIEDYSFLKLIDTSKTTNIGQMFQLTNFKDLKYIKDWDVSKVETMNGLFNSNEYVESLSGLENWDVSSVTNYNQLFYKASSLVDASAINDWNINSNASFTNMFYDVQTHPEFSKVLGSWNNKGTFIPGT